MKDKSKFIAGFVGVLWLVIGIYALSFIVTAGITYLIFWCFGWEWNWLIALGLWLLTILLRSIFGGHHD